jgi:aquaporin Z
MVYAIGGISGCHINPAITVAMLAAGKMKAKEAVVYVVAQCVGAVLGSGVLLAIATGLPGYSISVNGLGQNGYGDLSPAGFSMVSGFLAEVVLTFIFLIVIFGATSEEAPKGFAGIAIGLALVLIHLVGIPITGTSVNPARSLGPAIFVGGAALGQVWLFGVAPIIGALLAAGVWRALSAK